MLQYTRKIASLSLLLFMVSLVDAGRNIWPSHYDEAHQGLHMQLKESTHSHLQDFQVVIPANTDQDFRHVTYAVRHQRKNRVRRDAADDIDESGLYYAFSGYGHDFRLRLESNHQLLAPTFTVKRIKRGTESEEKDFQVGCHYRGHLVSHGSASAAMSTCTGLTGLLRTSEDDFLIEPIPPHLNHSFESPLHPHILYKRRHLDRNEHPLHYCGKKRHYPVQIPATSEEQTIKILSSGEIEFEDVEPVSRRKKRSLAYSQSSGFDVVDHGISPRERPRRKSIETLVVADRDMIRNHEHDRRDVTTYILTIMNMVSALFSDRSLDSEIDVVLSGLVLMEDNHELDLDHKADKSLANFCRWQYNRNRNQSRGSDHSILLTGIDICVGKNGPCETLGLAQIGGMCSKRHSCTVNEDVGLGVVFTIAHETGHSFGMRHDGQGNRCNKRNGHIMSPTLNGLNGVFTWSPCSRETLKDFLNDDDSICLDNHPTPSPSLQFPKQLPGEIYDSESQCKWQFGINTRLCDFRYKHKKTSICKVLWCQREGSRVCETKYMPAAEGTNCGDGLWCRRGVCVSYGSEGPGAVNGGWGNYGSWSTCTRTCGGGVQYRKRACDNPSPMYGGHYCQGKEKVYQLCNVETCPLSQISFREEQCSKFNRKSYRRQYFNWVPFTKYSNFGRGRCELLCKAEGYDFFDMLAEKVEDGTPCDSSSYDVCIEGKCEHVGCDLVLGSNTTLDACGVCNGDNSTCHTVTGEYFDDVKDSGYYEVVRIPRGARNIQIWEERCCTHSYIAIKSADSPFTYQLNGNWQVDLFGSTMIGGVQWKYERKSFRAEKLFTAGPLLEDIIVEILVVSQNPGVRYSYSTRKISNNLPGIIPITIPSENVYRWSSSFTECSASCAGGSQTSTVSCQQNNLDIVDDGNCLPMTKPQIVTRQCNNIPCPARWVSSQWSSCSTSCGTGEQYRNVSCMTLTSTGNVNVTSSDCSHTKRPKIHKKCKQDACPPEWEVGSWSECSRQCGRGSRSRTVRCRRGNQFVRRSACDRSSRPKSRERCFIMFCPRKYQWFVTDWDQCSTTCGQGTQRRRLQCRYKKRNSRFRSVSYRRCRRVKKPEVALVKTCSASVSCSTTPNPISPASRRLKKQNVVNKNLASNFKTSKWVASSWQKCSVSCGGGVQVRLVKCLNGGRTMASSACSHKTKPVSKRSCNTYKCSISASNEKPASCQDNFSWCYLVPQHGQCSHKYFGTQCCKTCSSSAR